MTAEPVSQPRAGRSELTEWFVRNWFFVLLVLLLLVAAVFVPNFATALNIGNVLTQMSLDGVVVIGMTILMVAWGIDLGVGSNLALCGVVYALTQNLGIPIAICLGVLCGALVGLVNGLIVTKLKINFFITTLATMVAVSGIALTLSNGQTIYGSAPGFDWIGQQKVGPLSVPFLVFVLVAIVGHVILAETRLGRRWYAIGGNPEAARRAGLDVDKYFTMAFVAAGIGAGVGGVLLASRASSASPAVGLETPLIAIASAVIGGTSLYGGVGTIPGAVAGIVLITVLRNLFDLTSISPYYQYVFRGLILVAVVVVDVLLARRRPKS